MSGLKPTFISMGEPGGIGCEIVLASFLLRHQEKLSPFVLIACPEYISQLCKELKWDISFKIISPDTPSSEISLIWQHHLPILPLSQPVTFSLGQADPENAAAVIEAIATGFTLVEQGIGSALVTAPIQKSSLQEAGFKYPGHTEYLEHLSIDAGYDEARSVMMLASKELKVVPLTIHIPLKDVPTAISSKLIITTTKMIVSELRHKFSIPNPRIAICGLNPHAGEAGKMGQEDITIIQPAIATLKSDGLSVTGPHPADSLFHKSARAHYDCVLAMYHDQALIPIKTIAFDQGVNVTLGLPIIRTSPDHGTALDIAGKRIARPHSMISAIQLAQAHSL